MQPLLLSSAEITAWVGSFIWPLVRVSAMLAVMPAIGGRNVPLRIRAAFALVLTALLMPHAGDAPRVDAFSAAAWWLTLQQALIGALMGLVLQLVLQAMIIAGEFISLSMGLGFAMAVDPQNGVQVPMLGQFFMLLGTLLFLGLNGHLALIQLVAESFTYVPLAGGGFSAGIFWRLIEWSSVMFTGAMSVALPAMISLLAINLTLGVITRAAPQLNIFSVGFPFTLLIGLLVLLFALPALPEVFEQLTEEGIATLNTWFKG